MGIPRDGSGGPGQGTSFLTGLQDFGFPGHIYPINPNATEILGLKAYPNLKSVPEHLDLVIVSIPAKHVPGLLRECGEVGARNVHIFTAGFDETGDQQRKQLGEEVKKAAKENGLLLMGPYYMGIGYVPRARMSCWRGVSPISGRVGFISQSGGHAGEMSAFAPSSGVYISKVVSIGNSYGLKATDFLEYFTSDPETDVITMYLEGAADGPKLFRMVRDLNGRKPVIVWKGGLSEFGSRAAASHTGSLAGSKEVWNAFFQQTNAVRAGSVEELVDAASAFTYLTPPKGNRLAVIGIGGGSSVAIADACAREGLRMPHFNPETYSALAKVINPAGTILSNPLDVGGAVFRQVDSLAQVVKAVVPDPNIDMILVAMNFGFLPVSTDEQEQVLDYLCTYAKSNPYGKPLVVALTRGVPSLKIEQTIDRVKIKAIQAGLPFYTNTVRACRALSRFAEYHRVLKETRP